MVKKIYGNFSQAGTNPPVLLAAYGDPYISLGFAATEGLPARDTVGDYRFMVGDELGTGDDVNKTIFCSFGLGSPVRSYVASVIDTMQISVRTFDKNGYPIDIATNFSIELSLNIPE